MTASKPEDQRTFASWAALTLAVAICLHQRHFTLSVSDPASIPLMLRHRCGQVLAVSAFWALAETLLAAERRFRRASRQTA